MGSVKTMEDKDESSQQDSLQLVWFLFIIIALLGAMISDPIWNPLDEGE